MTAVFGSRTVNNKGRHSFLRRRESEDENIYIDPNRDPSELMQEILFHVVKLDVSKNKKLGYLNGFVRLCHKPDCYQNLGYSHSDIFCCMRVPLFHEACEVRAAALRACRYLLQDVEATKAFCSMKLHYLVARSLDVLLDNRLERMHALRLMRKFLCVNPTEFPSAFTSCLVAIANEGVQERELLRACLATLAHLSLLNPEEFVAANGIGALLRNVIDCQQPKITEAILGALLFLFNDPKMRNVIKSDLGLEHLLAPFTDCHYRYPSEIVEGSLSEDRDTKLSATKLAVVAALRSWSGITYFSRTHNPGLPSLVEMLYLPYPDIRKNIIELMFEIFNLRSPEWTDDFSAAILSADPSATQSSWQLYGGYIVAEGSYVLPYASKDRTDLIENYFALLLLLFVKAGILEALAEVIIGGSVHLAVQATVLLGELLHMCNRLLPSDCCHHCNSLPSLISAAAAFKSPHEQNQASAAVTCLYRIHEMKKRGCVPYSLTLNTLLHICNPERKRKRFFGGAISKAKLYHYIKKDMSEVINQALKDTLIFVKEFQYWDWDLIDNILKNAVDALKKLEDTTCRSFIQKLLHFFKPSNKQFSEIELESECAQQIILTGYHFMEFLLEMDEAKSQEYIPDFLDDLNSCLNEVAKDVVPLNAILSPSKVLSTLSQSYFLFIGKLSCTSKGCKFLDKCSTFQNLLYLVSVTNLNTYVKLVVSALDYSKDGFSRTVLNKALTGTAEHSRLYATNYLCVLLRAGLPDFRKWAIEFLVAQLYDPSPRVSSAAVDILEEACNIPENLETLVSLRPSLLHLGDKGLLLLLRFLSIPSGFHFLQDSNFLYYEMERWKKFYNLKYVKIVEDLLNEALTRHRRGEDGTYGRRSSDTRHTVHNVYLPHHMYGQLVQHSDGLDVLISEDCLPELFMTICRSEFSSELHILQLKAALWAVGHVGSYVLGLPLLLKEGIVPHIIQLAAEAPVLSVRGTCFFVLGLLSATPEGASILAAAGWETVRRNRDENWPIIESACDVPLPFSSSHASSISSNNSEWPLGGLPYSLSFVIQTSEQNISASHSSQSLDIDDAKQSPSSSFSSSRSVQLLSDEQATIIRPRSSSDCQQNYKDTQFVSDEGSRSESFSNHEISDRNHNERIFKERSVSSYEMGNHKFTVQSKTGRSSSDVSRNSGHTEASVPNCCSRENNLWVSNAHSSQQLRTSLSPVPQCTSFCSSLKDNNESESQQPSILKQLSRGHSCYLHSPLPDNQPVFTFASVRDAHGYATLKNIQRRRVQSLCLQDPNSYIIDEDLLNARLHTLGPTPAVTYSPCTAVQSVLFSKSNNSLKSSASSRISENLEKQDDATNNSTDARFIGLCLPSNFNLLFSLPKEPVSSDSDVEVLYAEDNHMGLQLHAISNCLASYSSHGKAGLLRTTIDEEVEETTSAESEQMLTEDENISSAGNNPASEKHKHSKGSPKLTEDSPEGKALVRKEVMRCVTNLSSSIAVKASEQGLLNLKQKFPNAFQDICLYSEICLHMAKYSFRLPARRFLQELFLDANFVQLQWEAESVMGVANLPQLYSSDA